MSRVLVPHHSMYGRGEAMANAVVEGTGRVAVEGGSPYGTTTIADGEGSRQPSEVALDMARFQGRHVAQVAARLATR